MSRIDHPATCVEAEPFALRVTDDSMEPEFAAGCVIVVDPTGRVRDGAFVVAECAGELVFRSDEPAEQLRRNVTSPGGTTQAALKVLMAPDGLQPLMTAAIAAATRRSRELEIEV